MRPSCGFLSLVLEIHLFEIFIFSRVLLDTITIVDDNPSVRSSSLQLTASIKERSKVHLLMIVIDDADVFQLEYGGSVAGTSQLRHEADLSQVVPGL